MLHVQLVNSGTWVSCGEFQTEDCYVISAELDFAVQFSKTHLQLNSFDLGHSFYAHVLTTGRWPLAPTPYSKWKIAICPRSVGATEQSPGPQAGVSWCMGFLLAAMDG